MDALLDPKTRDYTGTRATSLQNAVYIRLETPLGSYWADPDLGSKLYLLARSKDTLRVHTLAVQYAEQALDSLVSSGRAQSVTVSSKSGETGWLFLLIDVVDAAGNPHHFQHPVKVS